MLANTAQQQRKQEAMRTFHEKVEYFTAQGHAALPNMVRDLRVEYVQDFNFLLSTLARLGIELKSYPSTLMSPALLGSHTHLLSLSCAVGQRNMHLKRALSQCNALLFYRMLSQRSISTLQTSFEDIYAYHGLDASQVASLCPAAACFSLHFPLQHSKDKTLRILRFVESECEVLPSKDRCPYLVVVELLEQPFPCKSDELFTEGRKLTMLPEDIALGKHLKYENPQVMPTIHAPPRSLAHNMSPSSPPSTDISAEPLVDGVLDNAGTSTSQPLSVHQPPMGGADGVEDNVRIFARPLTASEPIQAALRDSQESAASRLSHPADVPARFASRSLASEARPHRRVFPSLQSLFSSQQPPALTADLSLRGGAGGPQTPPPAQQSDAAYVAAWTERYATLPASPIQGPPAQQTAAARQTPPLHRTISRRRGITPSKATSDRTASFPADVRPPFDPQETATQPLSPLTSPPVFRPLQPSASDHNAYGSPPSDSSTGTFAAAYSSTISSEAPPAMQGIVRPKTWEEKKHLVQAMSPFGHLPGWTLRSFIVKAGDDLRKEVLAMQLIAYCQQIFQQEGVDIFLRPYQILNTGHMSGLVEFVEGAMSIDRIKKLKPDKSMTLAEYFSLHFGDSYSFIYAKAIQNFVRSLAGYSLITYLAQVRDRHNANLLIDNEGHMVHIDFGFIFGDSPGFNMNFESAPFKFTREYLDLIGGPDSQMFALFEDLFVRGFQALQKHADGLAAIVQLFYGDRRRGAAEGLKSRLLFAQSQQDILSLVRDSFDNWRTKQYDWFQQQSNNIQM
jgi:hypothetical protein